MNKYFLRLTAAIFVFFFVNTQFLFANLVAFYKVGTVKGTIKEVAEQVKNALTSSALKEMGITEFSIVGEYIPAKDNNLYVIAFTRQDLKDIVLKINEKGVVAGCVLRVGLMVNEHHKDSVIVSLLNPEYLFCGFMREKINDFAMELNQISMDVKIALMSVAREFSPYIASSLSEEEIMQFRYMVRMPSFNEVISLQQFSSFEAGVKVIQENLSARKSGTFKVYEIIFAKEKKAIFGVGLLDPSRGEAVFLSKLGTNHLTAMPYEIIIEGNEAYILDGKFRFPFFWSDMPVNKYIKDPIIFKTPRQVQEMMRDLTKF